MRQISQSIYFWRPTFALMISRQDSNKRIGTGLLGSLTLGLAPFAPEPHIVGKIRWVAGGAVGMQGMDWFDLLLHGAPWLFLIFTLGQRVFLEYSIQSK
ncbi:MAG: hypothetical protein JXQ87_13255 [Bacteroidia bacterium]